MVKAYYSMCNTCGRQNRYKPPEDCKNEYHAEHYTKRLDRANIRNAEIRMIGESNTGSPFKQSLPSTSARANPSFVSRRAKERDELLKLYSEAMRR